MADSQSWSPMFNAGWVAQTHKFPKSDIASVEKARASDAVRCLTTYQKEYRPMHARPPPSELPPQVVKRRNFSHVRSSSVIKDDPSARKQLIASRWQTPRNHRGPLEAPKVSETERILRGPDRPKGFKPNPR
mmetsp:Transcript_5672/g.20194  ORF Transcript_5672/g.20194 Transcript_5672/m.20194 type:complete len:132 (-) Transcript_5672:82-477(-)